MEAINIKHIYAKKSNGVWIKICSSDGEVNFAMYSKFFFYGSDVWSLMIVDDAENWKFELMERENNENQ